MDIKWQRHSIKRVNKNSGMFLNGISLSDIEYNGRIFKLENV